jgi:hypothetical protein
VARLRAPDKKTQCGEASGEEWFIWGNGVIRDCSACDCKILVSKAVCQCPLHACVWTFGCGAILDAKGQQPPHESQQTTSLFSHVGGASEHILPALEMKRPPRGGLSETTSGVLIQAAARTDCLFLFLRRPPMNPKIPSPPAKSGSAAGSGVARGSSSSFEFGVVTIAVN